MLIVPELKTVFILVPRTGSGTLYKEMQRVYTKAMLLYRHMEADGCPQGYDRWKRIGFVRHPATRLRSLYNFMKRTDSKYDTAHRYKHQTDVDFETWLLTNREVFTTPCNLKATFSPVLSRRDSAPENLRSQFTYLRPDLGTEIRKFETLHDSMKEWGLDPSYTRNVAGTKFEPISDTAAAHIATFCKWDLAQGCRADV